MAQLMPLPLNVSCFSKVQIGFTFLVPAQPGSARKRAFKRSDIFSNLIVSVTEKIGKVNFNFDSKEIHNLNLILIEMKSSITNCNSNDQLLQLVSIQLLQKAYFRQFMSEGSNYFTVFLLSLKWGSYF